MANSHSIRFINASITIGLLSLVVSLPGHRAATRFGAWPQLERGAWVEDSVLMDGVVIGEGAYVRRAILDKNAVVPPWARIGVDVASDKERYHVSVGGVTVLGKGARAIV